MKNIEIKAADLRGPKDPFRECSTVISLPETGEDITTLGWDPDKFFGVCINGNGARVKVQELQRKAMRFGTPRSGKNDKTPKMNDDELDTYVIQTFNEYMTSPYPVEGAAKDPVKTATRALLAMSPEEREAFIASLSMAEAAE